MYFLSLPRVAVIQIIRDIETQPREAYCGSIGWIAPNGAMEFNVAIRTVLIDRAKGEAEYGVGSGIVWDSDATAEYQECCLKTAILTQETPAFELLETMLWTQDGGYFLLDYHLQRLQDSAEYFGYRLDLKQVEQALGKGAIAIAAQASTVIASPDQSPNQPVDQPSDQTSDQPFKVRLLLNAQGQCRTEATAWHNPVQSKPLQVCLATEPLDPANPFLQEIQVTVSWNFRGEEQELVMAGKQASR